MEVKVTRKNIEDHELAQALSEYIYNERLSEAVMERLEKKAKPPHGREEIPEKYIRTITRRLKLGGRELNAAVFRNIEKWLSAHAREKKFLRREYEAPLLLPEQMAELRQLIESTFRKGIGLPAGITPDREKKWKAIGISLADLPELDRWITQSYVAGRVAHILTDASTYDEMMKLAQRLPLTRQDELILRAAQENAARYVTGYGRKMGEVAEDVWLEQHQKALNYLVQQYFSGDLKQTRYNTEGFTHEEVEALLSTDSPVQGIRGLASEFRARFKVEDAGRDWQRVAETEVRYATNLGRLQTIQLESGGNADDTWVYYIVQPTACQHCKKLYLEPDGKPRLFRLSEIQKNIEDTGGMNVGLKASMIGEKGGWVPNASTHPNCHCRPTRHVEGYEPISLQAKKSKEETE